MIQDEERRDQQVRRERNKSCYINNVPAYFGSSNCPKVQNRLFFLFKNYNSVSSSSTIDVNSTIGSVRLFSSFQHSIQLEFHFIYKFEFKKSYLNTTIYLEMCKLRVENWEVRGI